MKKTKIICTIGPACDSAEMIEKLMLHGMDCARLNFSHGLAEEHVEKIRLLREVSERVGKPVPILQDLAGPKIRIGLLPEAGVRLVPGQTFVLTSREIPGSEAAVSLSYPDLPREVREGDRLLLADGLMELVVEDTDGTDIRCCVITGGVLTSHKGINLPTGTIHAPALTAKDREDLAVGLAHGVDYVALSFVRTADDIRTVQELIRNRGLTTPVIAKIEKHEALEVIEEILDVADGIMVARGDLGVEIPLAEVPLIQKKLIHLANVRGKTVITATQMLRSMIDSPRPTRAEATDVANAVLDGTDAVMLSEETASGDYPVEAVEFMLRLIERAETGYPYADFLQAQPDPGVSAAVAKASCVLANHLGARCIIAHSQSGLTARALARFRPRQPIIALSPNEETVRRLALVWGCQPIQVRDFKDTDDLIEKAAQAALAADQLAPGELAVITLGHPLWTTGSTNMIRVKQL
ncbi:MAG TPA: pyruvate kinase [Syntrophus sp. (in: bacteria)]|nr:pyruvate kinase [Syntrophus sp. (in: bacteria)]